MSRCFPYPPPGYVRNGICDEALIESIKLQREGGKAKKERKKEKQREKRKKEKARGSGEIESKKQSHKKRNKDERSEEDKKGGDLQKRTKKETEHLEKSSLTEEHGHPHPVGSQTSSDSTLNSNKRQKLSSPPDGRPNSGSIIRIRLPSQRHRDLEVLPSKEQPCTAAGRTDDASIQVMHEPAPRLGKEGVEYSSSASRKMCLELAIRPSKEKPCLSTGVSENSAKKPCLSTGVTESSAKKHCSKRTLESSAQKPCPSKQAFESSSQLADTSVPSNLCGRCPPRLELKFKDVIENWVPLPMQSDRTDYDDQEWLFETKQNKRSGAKECELDSVGLSPANSTTWPRVCYLPEAEIYALPFTVPF